MSTKTTCLELEQPTDNETADVNVINENMNKIDNAIMYETAGGTGTAITLTLPEILTNGYPKTFIAASNNGGVATKINDINLYKPGTTTSPNLISGKAYTVWYNSAGDCFFIKASATGDALVSHVLAGKKFSNDVDTDLVGTIASKAAATYSPSTSVQTIASGQYLSGIQTIAAITGNASTAAVLAGYVFSSANGINLTGAMADYYNTDNIVATPEVSGTTLKFNIPNTGRYRAGFHLVAVDADFIAANIVSGKNIFGLTGSATITSLGGYKAGDTISAEKAKPVSTLDFSTTSYNRAEKVIFDNSGNYYVCEYGGYVRKFNASNVLQWSYNIGGILYDIKFDSTKSYLYIAKDAYGVTKLTVNGALVWTYYDPSASNWCYSVDVDASGNVYFGSCSGYTYKTNANGALQWSYRYSSSYANKPRSMRVKKDSSYVYGAFGDRIVKIPSTGGSYQILSSSNLICMVKDSNDYLYCLYDSGRALIKYDSNFAVQKSISLGEVYSAMDIDSNDKIRIIGLEVITKLNTDLIIESQTDISGLGATYMYGFGASRNSDVIVGLGGGMYRYKEKYILS